MFSYKEKTPFLFSYFILFSVFIGSVSLAAQTMNDLTSSPTADEIAKYGSGFPDYCLSETYSNRPECVAHGGDTPIPLNPRPQSDSIPPLLPRGCTFISDNKFSCGQPMDEQMSQATPRVTILQETICDVTSNGTQCYSNPEPLSPPLVRQENQVITNNENWIPEIKMIDGTEMVVVPTGSFMMGSLDVDIEAAYKLCEEANSNGYRCQRNWYEDEIPQSMQEITQAYLLDKKEVSRNEYQKCVNTGVCSSPPISEYSINSDQPINRVTWYQAAQYCEWRGARLPTEVEWEYAARGPDGLKYPWGNSMQGDEANHADLMGKTEISNLTFFNQAHNDGYVGTAPVGSYPQGASWVGALDMAGNVWEWTSTIYKDYPHTESDSRTIKSFGDTIDQPIVLRGGAFNAFAEYMRGADRFSLEASLDYEFIGFRCAYSDF